VSEVVISGAGWTTDPACDPRPFLHQRKLRKFMGAQDRMAVVAAGRALESAGLERDLGDAAGLFLAVGFLPFERADVDLLLEGSLDEEGEFSLRRFVDVGYEAVNPLLTFRCLSNMPAFHVSSSCSIRGPYLTSYPGPGQLYVALEEALAALAEGRCEVALWGGVAHQRNFLVEHHMSRVEPPRASEALGDGAALLVLETRARAEARGARARLRLGEWSLDYEPGDPRERSLEIEEIFEGPASAQPGLDWGAASLPLALAEALDAPRPGALNHAVSTRDGFRGRSAWEVLA
jgi:3-oxoacyl-(acyl-carrier-protein) synthase